EGGWRTSLVGTAIATIVAGILLVVHAPARARSLSLPAGADNHRSRRETTVATAALALLAVGAFLVARPMRAENTLAWPEGGIGYAPLAKVQTPALDGPDPIERAPVVEIARDHTTLNRGEADGVELHDRLLTLRTNYGLLHPD